MKQNIIWILALAAMAFSSTAHAQQSWPDSLMFEGINIFDTSYNEIIATFGEPDEYFHSPSEFGPEERFIYYFMGPEVLLGEGKLYLDVAHGHIANLIIQGGQYKLFTDFNGGVGPGDPIEWFAQNNFTLGPREQTRYQGVYLRDIVFTPQADSRMQIWETEGVVVLLLVNHLVW